MTDAHGLDRWTRLRRHAEAESARLHAEIAAGGTRATGWRTGTATWVAARPSTGHVCDYDSVPRCADRHDGPYTSRCGSAYWRAHSLHVADSMRTLAIAVGADPDLWELVGSLHDADYVEAPHHVAEVMVDDAHPMTLLRAMEALGAPASVRLALLEHAAHTELVPSTALAGALILADEHSTTSAYGGTLDVGEDGNDLLTLLTPAPHRLTDGYHRSDMNIRATAAVQVLLRETAP